jgi:hypothetical protein
MTSRLLQNPMVHYRHSLKPAGKEAVVVSQRKYPQVAFVTTIGYCLILGFSHRDMEALHSEDDEKAASVQGETKNWLQTSKYLPV